MKTNLQTFLFCGLFAFSISAKGDLVTSRPGRPPGKGLSMKGSKVPKYEIYQSKVLKGKKEVLRVKEIPRIDIGEEPEYKLNDPTPLQLPGARTLQMLEVKKLPEPAAVVFDRILLPKIEPARDGKTLVRIDPKWTAPEAPVFTDTALPAPMEPKLNQRQIEDFTASELKLLQALIFFQEARNYPVALGLFGELLDDKQVRVDAIYQAGLTANALGLYSEFKYQMLKILKEPSKEWQKRSVVSLAMAAEPGDRSLIELLDSKIDELKIELNKADQYQLNRSKFYVEKSDLTKALGAADEIGMDSPIYDQAIFLKSLILYKIGNLAESIGLQQTLLSGTLKKETSPELHSVNALTLSRLLFQQGDYKEAFQTYLQVDKKHPEWLQAMIEQAWSQILTGDYEGAAGNMFSLHTDFFKKAFAPESFVVRAVAYLNLCQYGDGSKVIFDLKKRYTPVKKKMEAYQLTNKDDIAYYDTVKNWAKNFDLKEVDGLPRELIFALTRHPSFINEQQMVNSLEDQNSRISKVTLDLINLEKELVKKETSVREEQARLRKNLDESKVDKEKQDAKESLVYQEKRLVSYRIQHHIAKKARTAVKSLRQDGIPRLAKEEDLYRKRAAKALHKRMDKMLATLNNTLDQSEVLQYELYSGAGEHLRYQMAGGKIDQKERPELKVPDNKALKWDFHGEVWEDEIGYFRSSLKNVCAPEDNVAPDEATEIKKKRKTR